MIKALLITCTLTISFSAAKAQANTWAEDSLAIYEAKIDEAINADDSTTVVKYYQVIMEQGGMSVHPLFFEHLYKATENEKFKGQNEILGLIWRTIGNLEFFRSRFEDSGIAFGQALKYYEKGNYRKLAARMVMNLGIISEKAADYEAAMKSYQKGLVVFQEFKDTAAIANCLENMGLVYMLKGEFKNALLHFDKTDSVLQTNTPEKSERWIGFWYNRSLLFERNSDYQQSLFFALKGLRLSEELKNDRLIGDGYRYVQTTYRNLNDESNWLIYIQKSRDFYARFDNKHMLANLNYDYADYFLGKNNYDSANYYAQTGLDFYLENEGVYDLGIFNGRILQGRINYQLGNYPAAIEKYEAALAPVQNPEKAELATVYQNLGSSYMKLKNFEEAINYLSKSLELRKEIGVMAHLQQTYASLSECSREMGDYESAYKYYVSSKEYADSIFNESRSRQIVEMQTQYETEKKDQAIAGLQSLGEIQRLKSQSQASQIYLSLAGIAFLLIIAFFFYNRARLRQKANKALEARNSEIAKRDKEKEMLLKEIHHRVKNNLQIISSLLNMQTRSFTDNTMIDAMKESQSRVKTMALIHEKLYQYENLSRINMREYMQQLSEFLSQTYRTDKAITIAIEAEDINLDIDTAVPLGLITNELLSNALKYAFQDMEQGEIKIVLSQRTPNGYQLIISDTGRGLAADLDITKSTSLGLKLVRTLTRQINGELSIQTKPGATFSISFTEANTLAA